MVCKPVFGHARPESAKICPPAAQGLSCQYKRVDLTVLGLGVEAVFQAVEAFRLLSGLTPDADRRRRHFLSMG